MTYKINNSKMNLSYSNRHNIKIIVINKYHNKINNRHQTQAMHHQRRRICHFLIQIILKNNLEILN